MSTKLDTRASAGHNTRGRYERLFQAALRIRLVEERIVALYPSDKIQSPVHLSIGQEAVAVGLCEALSKTDLMFCSYRSHAFYMAKGGDLPQMMAELYGRSGGMAGGKAGSMHLTAPDVGLMGSSAVVSSTIPHAAGAGLAAKLRKTGQVIVCIFGDGATEEGVYHETMNFVALHKLPVLMVCENNGLAIHTGLADRQSYRIAEHARAYGMPATVIENGVDPVIVADVFGDLIRKIRMNSGPQFAEVMTYRYREHVGPGEDYHMGYRERQELEHWQARDPLVQDKELVAKLTPAIETEIDAAVNFAEASPWPSADQLLKDVL